MSARALGRKRKETIVNEEQTTLWNGLAANAWIETRELIDQLFKPMEALLVEAAPEGSKCSVLDVGCGTGATTLAAARRIDAGGRALGVDISKPMIEVARERARQEGSLATFVCGDAQHHAFEAQSFDVILSRFGVMFFDDTALAFANLRRAARVGAKLRLLVWRGPEENPFMTAAEQAAAPLLPSIPARCPDAPGQFALASPLRVQRCLGESGWIGVDVRPVDFECAFPESELVPYFTRFGPLARVLHEADAGTRSQIIEAVRRAFEPYVSGAEVRFTAACWLVGARAPEQ